LQELLNEVFVVARGQEDDQDTGALDALIVTSNGGELNGVLENGGNLPWLELSES